MKDYVIAFVIALCVSCAFSGMDSAKAPPVPAAVSDFKAKGEIWPVKKEEELIPEVNINDSSEQPGMANSVVDTKGARTAVFPNLGTN